MVELLVTGMKVTGMKVTGGVGDFCRSRGGSAGDEDDDHTVMFVGIMAVGVVALVVEMVTLV